MTTIRGILGPRRSESSPRPNRPLNNHAAANPPPKPNYLSPLRRPVVANSNPIDLRNPKRENPSNVTAPSKSSKINHSSNLAAGSLDASKPTKPIVSSRRPSKAVVLITNDLKNEKKKDNHGSSKTTGKTSHAANTKSIPYSPSLNASNSVASRHGAQQKLRRSNSIEASKKAVKRVVAHGSKSNVSIVGNENGLKTSRSDPGVQDQINSMLGCEILENGNSDRVNDDVKAQSLEDLLGQLPIELLTGQKIYQRVDSTAVHSPATSLSQTDTDLADIVLANSTYQTSPDIKNISSPNDAPRIFQIYKDIASHHQGNQSITSYFTKWKTFWDELASISDLSLCSCGATAKLNEHGEREKVMQFLVGLNESYSTICGQILVMEPFPTVEKAYSLILREEKRRQLVMSLEIVGAKMVQNNWHQNDQSSRPNDHVNSKDDTGDVYVQKQKQENVSNEKGSETMLGSTCNYEIEVPGFKHEPMLIDLGSPMSC